jgi:hypothetical protein
VRCDDRLKEAGVPRLNDLPFPTCRPAGGDARGTNRALSHVAAVDHGLRNAYFAKRGLISVVKLHRNRRPAITAPAHPTMALAQR